MAVGFAQEAPIDEAGPPRPVLIDAPIVRHRVVPRYPPVRQSVPVECQALVGVDLEGHATSVEVQGCDLPFADATQEAVSQWTFEAMEQPFTARLSVPFAPISGSFAELTGKQLAPILTATRPMDAPRAPDAPCGVVVQIDPSGTVTDLRSNAAPTCLVRIDGPATTSKKAWKAVDVPQTCALEVNATPEPTVTVDTCPKALLPSATALAASWTFNAAKEGTRYDLDVVFAP